MKCMKREERIHNRWGNGKIYETNQSESRNKLFSTLYIVELIFKKEKKNLNSSFFIIYSISVLPNILLFRCNRSVNVTKVIPG